MVWCLNPYCNGIYLMIEVVDENGKPRVSLNPYCNGIYLMIRLTSLQSQAQLTVLILIVMEYT